MDGSSFGTTRGVWRVTRLTSCGIKGKGSVQQAWQGPPVVPEANRSLEASVVYDAREKYGKTTLTPACMGVEEHDASAPAFDGKVSAMHIDETRWSMNLPSR